MFKITNVPTRYFEMEAPDNYKVLHIEPPKLKTLQQIVELGSAKNVGVTNMADIASRIISKNREHRRVSADMVMEWMNVHQLQAFFSEFTRWINSTKANDPN